MWVIVFYFLPKGSVFLNYDKKRIFIAPLIIFTVLFALSNFYLYKGYINQQNEYIENQNSYLETQIDTIIAGQANFSSYIFKSTIDNDYVKKIVSDAYGADRDTQDQLRAKLYEHLKENYDFATQYAFRQIHFQFPDTTSFLRMHEPEKYGDSLGEIRESIKIVNEEHKYVEGFEEGKIYNGYRFIYPLSYSGDHIGSVEVSISFEALASVLSKLYEKDYFFAVKKSVVTSTLFEEELENYAPSFFSEDFLFDTGLLESEDRVLALNTVEMILESQKSEISSDLENEKNFGILTEYGGVDYILNFIPIENISGEKVAYFISLGGQTKLSHIRYDYVLKTFLVNLIILLLIFIVVIHIKDMAKLESLSYIDNLTKIYNRHKFLELADAEISRSVRYGSSTSLIIFDLDHFKKVNDTYGHNEGDMVLRKIVKIVSTAIRKTDVFARWGGEEFIVMLPETNEENAFLAAEKIRKAVESSDFGKVGKLTISLGVSSIKSCNNILNSIDLADKALYESKQTGRNKTSISCTQNCSSYPNCNCIKASELK